MFTGVAENVHAPLVVDAVAADRRDLVTTSVVEGIPSEEPVVAVWRVRIVHVQLQLALVQVRHFTIE